MADTPNNTPNTPPISPSAARYGDPRIARDEERSLLGFLDISKQINEVIKLQANNLHQVFDVTKSININLFRALKDKREINKLLKLDKEAEIVAAKKLSLAQNETQRKEYDSILKGIQQRIKDYEVELDFLNKILLRGWMPILYVISKAYHLFKDIDKAAWEFRKAMGMTRLVSQDIKRLAQEIAIEFMHVGVTFEGVFKSAMALSDQMGSIHIITRDLVKTTAILQSQLGVAEEDSAGFFRNMAAISKSTMESQENMAYMTADLSQAAGTKFPQIMKDVATRSATTLSMMSRIPAIVMRSAIELRKMGSSLEDAANSSHQILQFSTNVADEMEASVLLGRAINLQKARELAYRRDLEGSTKEILRITKSISFENLDVFQQEAFAKATGKSVDELLRMVVAERQWEAARRDPLLAGKVEKYEALRRANESIAKSSAENLKYMIEQRSNQERITAISQKWNQIIARLAPPILFIVDKFLELVVGLLPVLPILVAMGNLFVWISTKLFNLVGLTEKFSAVLFLASEFGTKILTPMERLILTLAKIGGWALRIGGFFGKWVPILGWIIMGVQLAIELWKGFSEYFKNWENMSWGKRIYEGFAIPFRALYNVIIQPFVDAFNWIMGLWGGKSPSKIGLLILEGIVSVGTMMFDALTSPFRRGLAWIVDWIPGMGKVAEKLRGGMGELMNKPVEVKASAAYIPAVQVTPNGTTIAGASTDQKQTPAQVGKDESILMTNETGLKLLSEICALRADLNAGKIGINMDGQLLSATLARQTDFHGGYGVNKV